MDFSLSWGTLMKEPLQLSPSSSVVFLLVVMLLCAPLTFGLTALVALGVYAVIPKSLDGEGVSMPFGRRFLWRDLKDIQIIGQVRYGRTFGYRYVFVFGKFFHQARF